MASLNRKCLRLGCSSKETIFCYRCIAPYCSQKCQQEDFHRHDAECKSIPSTITVKYIDGSTKEVQINPMELAKTGGQIPEELMRPQSALPAAGRNEVMPHPQQNGHGVSVNGSSSRGGFQMVARGGPQVAAHGGPQMAAHGGPQRAVYGGSQMAARGGPQMAAHGGSQMAARGGPQMAARGGPQMAARGGPQMAAHGDSQMAARGGPQMAAHGGSHMAARGGPQMVARGGMAGSRSSLQRTQPHQSLVSAINASPGLLGPSPWHMEDPRLHLQRQPYNNAPYMSGPVPPRNTFTPRPSNPASMQPYSGGRPPFSPRGGHERGGQVRLRRLRRPGTIRCMPPVAEKIRIMSSWLDFFSPGDEVSVYFTVNIKITGVNWCMLIPKNREKRAELAEALSAAVDISGLKPTPLRHCERWDQIVMTEKGLVLGRYIVVRLHMKVILAHMDLGTLVNCDQNTMVYVLPPERRMAPTVVPIHLTRDVRTTPNTLIPNFDLRVEERGVLRTANGDEVKVYDWDFGFAFDNYQGPVAIPWPLPPVGPLGRATLLAVTHETQAVDGNVLIAFRLQSDEAELREMENSLKEHQSLIWNTRSVVRFNEFGYTTDTKYLDRPRRFSVINGNASMIHVRYIDFAEEAHVNPELCALLPLRYVKLAPFARQLRVDSASITREQKLRLEGLAKQNGIADITILKVDADGPLEARLDLAENGGSFTGIILQENEESANDDLWAVNVSQSGSSAVPYEFVPGNSPPAPNEASPGNNVPPAPSDASSFDLVRASSDVPSSDPVLAPSDAPSFDSIRAPIDVPSFESPPGPSEVGTLAPTADVVDEIAGKMEDVILEPSVAEPETKDAAEEAAPVEQLDVGVDGSVPAVRPVWPTAVKYQELKVGEVINVMITGVPKPGGMFGFDFAGHLKTNEPEYEELIQEMGDGKFEKQHADYEPELHEIVRVYAMSEAEMMYVRAIHFGNERYLSLDSGEVLSQVSDVQPLPGALLASQPLINLFKFVGVGEGRAYVENLEKMRKYRMADAIVLLMVADASKAPIYGVRVYGRVIPE